MKTAKHTYRRYDVMQYCSLKEIRPVLRCHTNTRCKRFRLKKQSNVLKVAKREESAGSSL